METARLPKQKDDLVKALTAARLAAWPQRNRFIAASQIAHYYLRGYRRFKWAGGTDGRVLVGTETNMGELQFRNEDLRRKYATEFGRFMRMDVTPVVKRKKWGLDSLRKAAVGQVALDYACREANFAKIQARLTQYVLMYGTVGMGHWRETGKDGQPVSEVEVIPGWELLPFPETLVSEHEIQGILRYRMVPLDWLREKTTGIGVKFDIPTERSANWEAKLEVERVSYGSAPTSVVFGLYSAGAAYGTEQDDKSPTRMKGALSQIYVPLLEAFMYGPNNTISRYVAVVGKHVAADVDYEDQIVPMPISMVRHIPDGSFYSWGFVGLLIPGNHQQERMLHNLYRNIEELDAFGTVCWPSTAGASMDEFKRKNGRPKIVSYEPDYTVPDAKPFQLTPINSGDFPGRVAMMGQTFQDKLSGQGPLFSGMPVGRVDSGSGMGFTFEVNQIALAATAHQIADGWAQIYKSILYAMKDRPVGEMKLQLINVDGDVAGLSMSPTGELNLDKNPIPDCADVDIDIRDREPRSIEREKQELLLMYDKQLIDATDFRIHNYKNNLGFPVGNRQEFEGYRRATFLAILMFNDGQTPQVIDYNLVMENPMISLRALRAFTSRLEFFFASKEVRSAFEALIQSLNALTGEYPAQLPDVLSMMGAEGGPSGSAMPASPGGMGGMAGIGGVPGGMGGGMLPGGAV